MKWKDLDLKKWMKGENMAVMVLVGILLFVISLPTKKTESLAGEQKGVSGAGRISGADWEEEYVAGLENKLEELLGEMAGVGKVRVCVTLRSTRELVVEKDLVKEHSETGEEDSAGGNRRLLTDNIREQTIDQNGNGSTQPFVVRTVYPKVEGAVVIAEGAGDRKVAKSISETLQVLLCLEAYQVKVLKMG